MSCKWADLEQTLWPFFLLQKPFGDSAGSATWTEKVAYPGWGIFLVVVIVLVSTLPILIWLIKDWPRNWAQSFHKTFCTGLNNYLPDPKKDPNEEEDHPRVQPLAVL